MKKYFLLILLFASVMVHAQTVPNYIYGKDVIISMRDTSSAELTIKNSTRTVTGFLKNIGAGKTTFKVLDIADVTGLQTVLNGKLPATITTPSTGQLIRYNGTIWVNWNPTFLGITDTAAMLSNRLKISDTATMLNGYARSGNVVKYTDVGANNGVAGLDAGGKVPFSQLPASLYIYKGTWDASTNTPTLANGSGTSGWVYQANVAGTVNFGAGAITFAAGDYVGYNGSIWQWSPGTNAVRSVNGQQGVVSLTTANIPEGGTDYYWTAARSRAAQSVTVTGLSYDNSTGVISLTSGYVIPTTTEQSNWNTAYGWGNHASAGYLSATTAASTYLPLSGGTLTGSLIGTNANFTGSVAILGSSSALAITDRTNTSRLWNLYSPNGKMILNSATGAGGVGDVMDWNYTTGLVTAYYGMTVTGTMTATSFTGAGTGLTGTASSLSIGGNAATVTNGVYTSGSYSDPTWITSLNYSKLTGTVPTWNQNTTGNAATVSNGVYTTGSYSDPTWITSLAGSKITGNISGLAGSETLATVTGRGASTTIQLSLNGGILLSTSTTASTPGQLLYNAASGTTIYAKAGSINDYTLYNGAGSNVMTVATGTVNTTFYGSLTAGAISGTTGTFSGDVLIGTGSPNAALSIVRNTASGNISDYAAVTVSNSNGAGYSAYAHYVGATYVGGLRYYAATDALDVQSYGSIVIKTGTSFTTAVTIANNQAITAASSISATTLASTGGGVYSNGTTSSNSVGAGSLVQIYNTSVNRGWIEQLNASQGLDFWHLNGSWNIMATISAAGAGTFASTVTATAFYESSDIRQKKVHTTVSSIDGIDAILYTFKPNGNLKMGYSAQQVQKILPFAVTKGNDGFLKLDYTTVHTYKLSEHDTEILDLKKRISQLEKRKK